jgi:peptide-methionine (S)-S-oxide reductase
MNPLNPTPGAVARGAADAANLPQLAVRRRFVNRNFIGLALAAVAAFGAWTVLARGAEPAVSIPAPSLDEPAPTAPGTETVVLSGGCFWGVQKVFQHVKGVRQAVSGYAGGAQSTADYETVSTGRTGHAESVQVTFDPAVVSLGTILRVFFSVAHDPTQRDRQGPDVGTQYRSEIFTTSAAQARVAQAYVKQLDAAGVFGRPIATRIDPLQGFYPAEAYHQDYATRHPESGYIAFYDLPKVRNLESMFPQLYRSDPVLVSMAAAPTVR